MLDKLYTLNQLILINKKQIHYLS